MIKEYIQKVNVSKSGKVYSKKQTLEEIVRCKDCIYKDRIMCTGLPLRTGYSFEMSVSDDDYCSFGEREEEGE